MLLSFALISSVLSYCALRLIGQDIIGCRLLQIVLKFRSPPIDRYVASFNGARKTLGARFRLESNVPPYITSHSLETGSNPNPCHNWAGKGTCRLWASMN